MIERFIYCHTLRLNAPTEIRVGKILPCDIHEAVEILALFLVEKSLVSLPFSKHPQGIWTTKFYIARLSPKQLATGSFTPEFLNVSSLPIIRQLELWLYHRRLILPRQLIETGVPEMVFEIFQSPMYPSREGTPVTREGLIVARINFWGQSGGATYLRFFIGWHETASPEQCEVLKKLLNDYVKLVNELHEAGKNTTSPLQKKGHPDNEPSVSMPTSVKEETQQPTSDNTIQPQATEFSVDYQALENSTPPRFYRKALYKICKMAIARQKWIDEKTIIQDIEWTRKYRGGPSRNTILKVKELVLYWNNRNYRWDVEQWLHQATGHTADEATNLLNDLRLKFESAEWKLITDSKK